MSRVALPLRAQQCGFGSSPRLSAEPEAAEAQAPDETPEVELSPRLAALVDEIAGLSVLEVSQLTQALRSKLNIKDAPVMMGGAMPMAPAGGAGAPAEEAEAEDNAPKADPLFTVSLTAFDAASKVKLIREIKGLVDGMNLVQAKKFVEGVPSVIRENVKKEEAEKIKEQLAAVGGTVSF